MLTYTKVIKVEQAYKKIMGSILLPPLIDKFEWQTEEILMVVKHLNIL